MDQATLRLTDFSIALYTDNGLASPSYLGSGVLLAVDNERFIVTAAHVFPNGENSLVLGLPERRRVQAVIDGAPTDLINVHFAVVNGYTLNVGHQTLDLMILRLDRAQHYCRRVEQNLSFLSPAQLDTRASLVGKVVMTGFKSQPTMTAIRFTTIPYRGERGRPQRHDPALEHAVHWDLADATFTSVGMSGGGVWTLDPDFIKNPLGFKLAGITTEWDPKTRVAISAKAFYIAGALRHFLPHLTPHLAHL